MEQVVAAPSPQGVKEIIRATVNELSAASVEARPKRVFDAALAGRTAQELLAYEVATKPTGSPATKKGKEGQTQKSELWTVYELATACPGGFQIPGLPPPTVPLFLRVDLTSRDLAENSTKILIEQRHSLPADAGREMFRAVTEKQCFIGADYNTEIKSMVDADKEQIFELPDAFHNATGGQCPRWRARTVPMSPRECPRVHTCVVTVTCMAGTDSRTCAAIQYGRPARVPGASLRLAFRAAAERETAPGAIEKPDYTDLDYDTKPTSTTKIDTTKTFGSQTDTSSLSALNFQHVYVSDEWAVVCGDVVDGKCENETLLHCSVHDTCPRRLLIQTRTRPTNSMAETPSVFMILVVVHQSESTRYGLTFPDDFLHVGTGQSSQ